MLVAPRNEETVVVGSGGHRRTTDPSRRPGTAAGPALDGTGAVAAPPCGGAGGRARARLDMGRLDARAGVAPARRAGDRGDARYAARRCDRGPGRRQAPRVRLVAHDHARRPWADLMARRVRSTPAGLG